MINPTTKYQQTQGRTPQGVRGLKFYVLRANLYDIPVAPRKGCVD